MEQKGEESGTKVQGWMGHGCDVSKATAAGVPIGGDEYRSDDCLGCRNGGMRGIERRKVCAECEPIR